MACFTATYTHGTADKRVSNSRESVAKAQCPGPGAGALRDIACSRMSIVGQTVVICCRSLWSVIVSCKEEFSQDTQD